MGANILPVTGIKFLTLHRRWGFYLNSLFGILRIIFNAAQNWCLQIQTCLNFQKGTHWDTRGVTKGRRLRSVLNTTFAVFYLGISCGTPNLGLPGLVLLIVRAFVVLEKRDCQPQSSFIDTSSTSLRKSMHCMLAELLLDAVQARNGTAGSWRSEIVAKTEEFRLLMQRW